MSKSGGGGGGGGGGYLDIRPPPPLQKLGGRVPPGLTPMQPGLASTFFVIFY